MQKQYSVYYAHSAENQPEFQWQTLVGHLTQVGETAVGFAFFFDGAEIARYTGLLHDLGKYSQPYKQRLRGGKRVNHSTAGAKIAAEQWGNLGKMMAFCIAGHHAGLADGAGGGNGRMALDARLKEAFGADVPALDPVWQEEIGRLPEKIAVTPPKLPEVKELQAFSRAFYTRMVYSCLADADFLDTERFYLGLENKTPPRGNYPGLQELHTQFNRYIQAFRQKAAPRPSETEEEKRNAELNRIRSEVSDYAGAGSAATRVVYAHRAHRRRQNLRFHGVCFGARAETRFAPRDLCDSVYQHHRAKCRRIPQSIW